MYWHLYMTPKNGVCDAVSICVRSPTEFIIICIYADNDYEDKSFEWCIETTKELLPLWDKLFTFLNTNTAILYFIFVGGSVGIVRSRTTATEYMYYIC
jgi:hypothetical protein